MLEDNSLTTKNDKTSILINLTPGADTIVFHFSSRNKPAGKFHKYPTPSYVSNVYINPADLNWYLDGLPDFGSLENTLAHFRSIIREAGASQVVCVGSSMGAWGAAYIGAMIGATKMILFGPELHLNCFASYSAQNIAHRANEIPEITAEPTCGYTVLAGMLSPCDVYGTVKFFKGAPPKSCYFLPNSGHGSAHDLNQMGILEDILETVIRGDSSHPVLDAMQHKDPAAISEFLYSRSYDIQTILDYTERFVPKNRAAKFVAGIASDLMSKKLFPHAFRLLWTAYSEGEAPNELKILLLRAARKAKQNAYALKVADELISIPMYRRDALWEKALVLERLKRMDESFSILAMLCREHLQDPIYKTASEKLAANACISTTQS
ncbi:hypothetical protein LWS69_11760 [Bordetella hinzii]|nr:hypothetical protein [Bordetella hinzii]